MSDQKCDCDCCSNWTAELDAIAQQHDDFMFTPSCPFTFEGVEYLAPPAANSYTLPILLPDRTLLCVVGGWYETFPPRPVAVERMDVGDDIGDETIDYVSAVKATAA
jgi:hypothetical protein